MIFKTDLKTYTLMVRSLGWADKAKSLALDLSEPAQDEECSIVLEKICDYRLPFVPEDPSSLGCPLESQPHLTKASLPCGHGFNAMALLYHFAKNSMTCPFCRAGHEGVLMGELSIPEHVRKHFKTQLEKVRAEDQRERLAADTQTAVRLLEQEVAARQQIGFEMFLPLARVMLIVNAYESFHSSAPLLGLELPLTSSQTHNNTLAFVSSGYCLRQLGLTLRLMPVEVRAFELVMGARSLLDGDSVLFRTVRFAPIRGARLTVAAASTGDDESDDSPADRMSINVQAAAGRSLEFTRFEWDVTNNDFSSLVIRALTLHADRDEPVEV
jgi:hypothetical protein